MKIPPECMSLAKMQVAELRKNPLAFDVISKIEYNLFANYIPKHRPLTLLDLGCGLGRVSAYIHGALQDHRIHYVFADTSRVSRSIKNGWDPGKEYYNNLRLTEAFVQKNGIKNFALFDILKDNWSLIPKNSIGFVVSMLAVGLHYPIEPYIKILNRVTTENATMAFGVRVNHYRNLKRIGSFAVTDRLKSLKAKEKVFIFRKQDNVNNAT